MLTCFKKIKRGLIKTIKAIKNFKFKKDLDDYDDNELKIANDNGKSNEIDHLKMIKEGRARRRPQGFASKIKINSKK